jgi:hypothetical protein
MTGMSNAILHFYRTGYLGHLGFELSLIPIQLEDTKPVSSS